MRWLAGLSVAAAVGCASVPVSDPFDTSRLRADALVLEGCYACLLEAQALYDSLPASPATALRRFETALLIVIREKELAADTAPSFATLRAAARDVPVGVDVGRFVDLAQLLPAEALGTPARAREPLPPSLRDLSDDLEPVMAWLRAEPTIRPVARDYLDLALSCAFDLDGAPPVFDGPGVPPLIVYRQAICSPADRDLLESLLRTSPRFVEAGFFVGQARVARAAEGLAGVPELLAGVAETMTRSVAVAVLQGVVGQLTADCGSAVDHYARAVQLQPLHDGAWLGLTICLSDLGRHAEAIAAATTLIDDGLAVMEGYYWRAWNHHAEARLASARRDIDEARVRGTSQEILTLAGIIEHDQEELDLAERDLAAATRGRSGLDNCSGWWYFGSVAYQREDYRPSAERFEQAMACFGRRASAAAAERDAVTRRENLDAGHRARLLTDLDQRIVADRRRQRSAAFNAAAYFAAVGERDRSLALLRVADADPDLAVPIADLRRRLAAAAVSE